jgi:hypothetical protein
VLQAGQLERSLLHLYGPGHLDPGVLPHAPLPLGAYVRRAVPLRYRVHFLRTQYAYIDVVADSPSEAEAIANNNVNTQAMVMERERPWTAATVSDLPGPTGD